VATARKKSKIKKRLLQAAVLLALAGILAWVFMPSPIPVQVDEARSGSFSTTLDAEGETQARQHVVVWAPVAGILHNIALAVGDPVSVEQVVARFLPDAAALQDPRTVSYLNARITAAAAAKNRALAERAQTAVAVSQARENLGKAEQLTSNSAANAEQRDQAQVAMKLIFKELGSMDAAAQSAAVDIAAAEAALRRIKNAAPREWVMHAPISGTALAVADNGKPLGIGDTLVEIGNPADLEVIVETHSSAAAQVSVGQRVQVMPAREDALPGIVRRVDHIPAASPVASVGAAAQDKTRIAIEFATSPSKWRKLGHDHAVHARITLSTIDNVLKVPIKVLIADGQ
jgi:HlyD family secretion protein